MARSQIKSLSQKQKLFKPNICCTQMILKHNLPWIIVIVFFATCARQTSPTGGPQDTIPPRLVSATPAHRSTNFQGKTIELTFSEFIALNNPKEQLIITPSPGKE